jgi:hypothetical protein
VSESSRDILAKLDPARRRKVLAQLGDAPNLPATWGTMKRRSKYGAIPTYYGGVRYASKKEARRAAAIDFDRANGLISGSMEQCRFVLEGGVCYLLDFAPFIVEAQLGGGWYRVRIRFEDVKGFRTKEFRNKSRQVLARHGVTIEES